MMNRIPALALALLVLTAAPPARATDAGAVTDACRALQTAVDHGDAAALLKARAGFQALSSAEPAAAALHYWVAVATWRVVPRLDDKAQAERLCQDGLDHCEAALRLDRRSGAVHAIKAALLGLMIGYRPAQMMTLGMSIEEEFAQARAAEPREPRTWLLDGISVLHKPASFGGGPAAAREKLQKSVDLFTANPADSTGRGWGRDDALIWLGRAALAQQDSAAAESLYTRALQVNPANGWVRSALLPQLRKARGAVDRP